MERGNETQISEFHLLGFSEEPELQMFLFGLFLSMYLVTIFRNLLYILATITDFHLHMPMYFFLYNLSFIDICVSSTIIPKVLVNIHTQRRVITYASCLTQMSFFILFVVLDDFLLVVMAYDHFVAICHPLHYMVIMNSQLCVLLILGSWITTVLYALLQSLLVLWLFIGIIFSYYKIVSSIHLISSALGKYKAFSTCVSHLSVVSLFYSTSIGVYISSFANHHAHASAPASVMYTIVTPMLNPFIYSLRNEDIKKALRRFLLGKT